jgi:cell division initiation protein
MNFTPNDIQNILFKKSLFGFNQFQVNDVLDKIVEDFSDLIRENAKMKDKLEDLQDKVKYYKTIENSLQNSLIVAQQTSDDIVANAKKNAENILKEAELNAQEIIEKPTRKSWVFVLNRNGLKGKWSLPGSHRKCDHVSAKIPSEFTGGGKQP